MVQKTPTLADEWFDFANYFGVHGARLQTPSFMSGKRKLSLKEVVMAKTPSEVHIHVDRMIGLLKINAKYYKVHSRFVPLNTTVCDYNFAITDKNLTIYCLCMIPL